MWTIVWMMSLVWNSHDGLEPTDRLIPAGWQGNPTEAEQHLQESVALYQTLGDRSSMATVLHGLAEMVLCCDRIATLRV